MILTVAKCVEEAHAIGLPPNCACGTERASLPVRLRGDRDRGEAPHGRYEYGGHRDRVHGGARVVEYVDCAETHRVKSVVRRVDRDARDCTGCPRKRECL